LIFTRWYLLLPCFSWYRWQLCQSYHRGDRSWRNQRRDWYPRATPQRSGDPVASSTRAQLSRALFRASARTWIPPQLHAPCFRNTFTLLCSFLSLFKWGERVSKSDFTVSSFALFIRARVSSSDNGTFACFTVLPVTLCARYIIVQTSSNVSNFLTTYWSWLNQDWISSIN